MKRAKKSVTCGCGQPLGPLGGRCSVVFSVGGSRLIVAEKPVCGPECFNRAMEELAQAARMNAARQAN